jgi:hypothetical protein
MCIEYIIAYPQPRGTSIPVCSLSLCTVKISELSRLATKMIGYVVPSSVGHMYNRNCESTILGLAKK